MSKWGGGGYATGVGSEKKPHAPLQLERRRCFFCNRNPSPWDAGGDSTCRELLALRGSRGGGGEASTWSHRGALWPAPLQPWGLMGEGGRGRPPPGALLALASAGTHGDRWDAESSGAVGTRLAPRRLGGSRPSLLQGSLALGQTVTSSFSPLPSALQKSLPKTTTALQGCTKAVAWRREEHTFSLGALKPGSMLPQGPEPTMSHHPPQSKPGFSLKPVPFQVCPLLSPLVCQYPGRSSCSLNDRHRAWWGQDVRGAGCSTGTPQGRTPALFLAG